MCVEQAMISPLEIPTVAAKLVTSRSRDHLGLAFQYYNKADLHTTCTF